MHTDPVYTVSTVACYQLGKYYIIMLLYSILHYNIITLNVHIYPIVSLQSSLESIYSIQLLINTMYIHVCT